MFNYPALVSMYHRLAIIQTTSLKFVVGLLCTAIILSASDAIEAVEETLKDDSVYAFTRVPIVRVPVTLTRRLP